MSEKVGVQYLDRDGKPDPTRVFRTWEDWVEFHDNLDRQHHESIEKKLLPSIGKFVREQIEKACAPLRRHIAELETRGVNYCGIYQRAVGYKRGDVVTHDGSMFVAVAEVAPNQLPGAGGPWQLAVKRGADGKDVRTA